MASVENDNVANDTTILDVYFSTLKTKVVQQNVAMRPVDLISILGGLLGLWVVLSYVSLVCFNA